MTTDQLSRLRIVLIWTVLLTIVAFAIGAALTSPLLEWRDPVYVAAGLGGVTALALLLFQPLLAIGLLPGLSVQRSQLVHRWIGIVLVLCLIIHVVGLWITSPPDVIDALLFTSPTPFSVWGVLAMWAVFVSAGLVVLRQPLRLQLHTWRLIHKALAFVIVAGTVVHAMLIEGTMGILSKVLLCSLVAAATAGALIKGR